MAVKEMVRVLKPGGTLALTIDYNLSSSPDKVGFNEKELMEQIVKPSGLKLKGDIDLKVNDWKEKVRGINRFFNTRNEAVSVGVIMCTI